MRLFYVLTLSFTLLFSPAFSQYYDFEVANEPYQSLTTGDLIDYNLTANTGFTTTAKYAVFGQEASNLYTAGVNGFLVSSATNFSFTYDPFLASLQKRDTTSSLIITESWDGSDSILTVQWNNMGLQNHPASDFVNMQLRLYRFQEKLEFHYGPSQVTDTSAFSGFSGPVVNFSWLSLDFFTGYQLYWLSGSPTSPSVVNGVQSHHLGGVPAPNTVYRFFVEDTTVSVPSIAGLGNTNWTVFPNPSTEQISWSKSQQKFASGDIIDLNGRLVKTLTTQELNEKMVSVVRLPAGSYALRLNTLSGQSVQKTFVKIEK